VWVTAAISCIIGGFVTGTVDRLFLTSASPLVSEFLPAVIAGIMAGAALYLLMPSMSGRMVGLGTAVLAGFSGAMVGLVASKLLGTGPATWVLTLGASVLLITWMVSGASTRGAQFRPFQQQAKSWNDIEAMDREGVQMQHDQAERGYWGSMEETGEQDEA
jgi:peptidoglycan/LPS O-acetylase OafA/YrhL